jgi:hypothetical protein
MDAGQILQGYHGPSRSVIGIDQLAEIALVVEEREQGRLDPAGTRVELLGWVQVLDGHP